MALNSLTLLTSLTSSFAKVEYFIYFGCKGTKKVNLKRLDHSFYNESFITLVL